MPKRTLMAGALLLAVAGTAQAEQWEIAFDAYGGGVPLAQGVLRLSNGDGKRYDARLDTTGASWFSFISRFRYEAEARGTLTPQKPLPVVFRGERNTRSKRHVMALRFQDGTVTPQAEPPMMPEKLARVPEAARRGSVDPLSAGIAVIMNAGGPGACTGTYPVYDGRRRYDVQMRSLGTQVLEPSRRRMAAGPAQACQVTLRPVAGFDPDKDNPNEFFKRGAERTATLWFMPVQGRTIPIQAEVETDFGSFYVHTTGFTVSPQTAARE